MEILNSTGNLETESKGNRIKILASKFGSLIVTNPNPSFILPGAFKKTIQERFSKDPKKNKVRILWMHTDSEPIGRPLELYESSEGLICVAEIVDTVRGNDALKLVRNGVLTEASIGFDSVRQEIFDYKRSMNFLDGLELSEVANRQMFNRIRESIENSNEAFFRFIQECRLWEISLVSWGADSQTSVEAASLNKMMIDHDEHQNSELQSALLNSKIVCTK